MYWSSSRSCCGDRFNCSSMCSIEKSSATNPRSFCLFASGRVLPARVANLLSSTFCVIRTARPFWASAMGPTRVERIRMVRMRVEGFGKKRKRDGVGRMVTPCTAEFCQGLGKHYPRFLPVRASYPVAGLYEQEQIGGIVMTVWCRRLEDRACPELSRRECPP